jgi:hypothetical protein
MGKLRGLTLQEVAKAELVALEGVACHLLDQLRVRRDEAEYVAEVMRRTGGTPPPRSH